MNIELLSACPKTKTFTDMLRPNDDNPAGISSAELVRRYLYEDMQGMNVYFGKSTTPVWCKCTRGSYVSEYEDEQLHQTDVMVVMPNPLSHFLFCYKARTAYQTLFDGFEGLADKSSWYVTHLVGYAHQDYDNKQVPMSSIKDWRPIFEQELYAVRPKIVLAFGTQVANVLIGVKGLKLEGLINTAVDARYTFADGSVHNFKVIVFPTYASLLDQTKTMVSESIMDRQIKFFEMSTELSHDGKRYHRVFRDKAEAELAGQSSHLVIHDPESLKFEVDRILELAKTDPSRRVIAVDFEWEGEGPWQQGAQLLTVQFSSKPGEAAVVVINSHDQEEHGTQFSKEDLKKIAKQLSRLLTWHDDWRPRVGGHFFRADLHWLSFLGVKAYDSNHPEWDVMWSHKAPDNFDDVKTEGGWDTSLMYHAYDEKDEYGLKYLVTKTLGLPAWQIEVEKLTKEFKEKTRRPITGYGFLPDDVLHRYAAWDADMTRRLAEAMMYGIDERGALLDHDILGHDCWRPYWLAHRATPGVFEIEETGIFMDQHRFRDLSYTVWHAYESLLSRFREEVVRWPEFNPSSTAHKQAVLFGREYAGLSAESRSAIPSTMVSFNLDPVYTSKDKKLWEELEDPLDEGYAPSTDKRVLNFLSQQDARVAMLRDICILKHVLNSTLSMPTDPPTGMVGYLFNGGYKKYLRECDSSIHTTIRTLAATGRWSSSKPNMQNIGKSQEAVLMSILGYREKNKEGQWEESGTYLYKELSFVDGKWKLVDSDNGYLDYPHYLYPIRTMFRAKKDYVLLEADFKGAELAVMAWVSQDPNMLDHVRRNALDEDDPDFYDIHSHVAVNAFHLDCEPTKSGLASIHKKHLRVAAKSVVFGIPYGRSAKAIAFQCRSDGIDVSDEEAEALVQSYFDMYPKVNKFLEDCRDAVVNPTRGCVQTLFGRYRRFVLPADEQSWDHAVVSKMQREFCNAPIQGTVADAVNTSIYNLLKERYTRDLDFKIVMQIHDSLVCMVHKKDVKEVYEHVLRKCMVDDNPVLYVNKETGEKKEYHFAIDIDMAYRWGEGLTEAVAQKELGCSLADLR